MLLNSLIFSLLLVGGSWAKPWYYDVRSSEEDIAEEKDYDIPSYDDFAKTAHEPTDSDEITEAWNPEITSDSVIIEYVTRRSHSVWNEDTDSISTTTSDPEPASDPEQALDPVPAVVSEPAADPTTTSDPEPASNLTTALNPKTDDATAHSTSETDRDPTTTSDPEPASGLKTTSNPETDWDATTTSDAVTDWYLTTLGPAADSDLTTISDPVAAPESTSTSGSVTDADPTTHLPVTHTWSSDEDWLLSLLTKKPSHEIPPSYISSDPFAASNPTMAPLQPKRFITTVQVDPQSGFESYIVHRPITQIQQIVPLPYTVHVSNIQVQSPFMQVPAMEQFSSQGSGLESHHLPSSYPLLGFNQPTHVDDDISTKLAKKLMKNEEFANIFANVLMEKLPREAYLLQSNVGFDDPDSVVTALQQAFRKNEKFKKIVTDTYAEVKQLNDWRYEPIHRFVQNLINDSEYEPKLQLAYDKAAQAKWHPKVENSFDQLNDEQKNEVLSAWSGAKK